MKDHGTPAPAADAYVRRFDDLDRRLHIFLMTSFLGLALTGLPLLFSERKWAKVISHLFGGFKAAGGLHRFFAIVMVIVFFVHLSRMMKRLFLDKDTTILWGPGSMVPQPRDLSEMLGHIKWFVGLGPRPNFDRFTYWEKFDYWAVFWGMGIIGGSGFSSGSRSSSRASCPATGSTSPSSSTGKRRFSRPSSSSRSTSSTGTSGPRSSRWTR